MASEKKQKKQKGSLFGFGKMTKDMGIDLGTANTLVYIKGQGIVLREPSVVAIRDDSKDVLAVGEEAKRMIGRTPGNIKAIRPMKDGVIADFDITQSMLTYFIQKSAAKKGVVSARIAICVPYGVTEVEKKAIEEAAQQAGAKEVFLIEEPMAAAIGAGGIDTAESIRIGGNKLDEAIVNYVKKEYNLLIGERTAEDVKINIGSAYKDGEEVTSQISGRDLVTGLPKKIDISSSEIRDALKDPINTIVNGIKITLEKTKPELAADLMENGIMLTGGGALLKGLDLLVKEETGMPVFIAEYPLDCVAIGTGKSVEDQEIFEKVLVANKRR